MIAYKTDNRTTLINILKYEDYQSESTTGSTADPPQTHRRVHTSKEVKKDKKDKNNYVEAKPPLVSNNLQRVILAWKMHLGFDVGDKAWDKALFKRHLRPAQKLLEFFDNDWETTCRCIVEVGSKLRDLGRSYQLETVLAWADRWKLNQNGDAFNGSNSSQILANNTPD